MPNLTLNTGEGSEVMHRLLVVKNPWSRVKQWARGLNLWYVGARGARRLGAGQLATRLLERGLRAQPQRKDLHLEAGRFYLKLGQLEKAAWHCRQFNPAVDGKNFVHWLESTCREPNGTLLGNRFDILSVLGNWHFQIGDYHKALDCFGQVAAGGRLDPIILNNKGLCLLRLGRDEEALSQFQQAAALKGIPEILVNMGLALNRLGRYQEALDCYERAQRKGYASQELLVNKGYALFHLERYDEAVLCFEMAKALAPMDIAILNNLAACYQKLGQFESAAECYTTALRYFSHEAALHNNYALCLMRQRRYQEALTHYDRALELEAGNETFLANKAQCLSYLNRHEEALAICDHLLWKSPQNSFYWGLKADILTASGAGEEAVEYYNRSLGLTG